MAKNTPKKATKKPKKTRRQVVKPRQDKKIEKTQRKSIRAGLRYALLEKANFCCQACGISASLAQLEIDHKMPLVLGGQNIVTNYQVLCLLCNRGKGAKKPKAARKSKGTRSSKQISRSSAD